MKYLPSQHRFLSRDVTHALHVVVLLVDVVTVPAAVVVVVTVPVVVVTAVPGRLRTLPAIIPHAGSSFWLAAFFSIPLLLLSPDLPHFGCATSCSLSSSTLLPPPPPSPSSASRSLVRSWRSLWRPPPPTSRTARREDRERERERPRREGKFVHWKKVFFWCAFVEKRPQGQKCHIGSNRRKGAWCQVTQTWNGSIWNKDFTITFTYTYWRSSNPRPISSEILWKGHGNPCPTSPSYFSNLRAFSDNFPDWYIATLLL